MDKETLLALAARCEAAEGPDRELDARIALARGWVREWNNQWWPPHIIAEARRRKRSKWYCGKYEPLPRFTASLDAALRLVPEGCEWVLWSNRGARVVRFSLSAPPLEYEGSALCATPALALCAAALPARAEALS